MRQRKRTPLCLACATPNSGLHPRVYTITCVFVNTTNRQRRESTAPTLTVPERREVYHPPLDQPWSPDGRPDIGFRRVRHSWTA